jgi:NMD protein affecting ribosome stability and mRNA decay
MENFTPNVPPDYTKPLTTDMCPMCHRVNMKGYLHSTLQCKAYIRQNIEKYKTNLDRLKNL